MPSSLLVIPTTFHKLISPQNVFNFLDQLFFSIVINNDTKLRHNFLVHNNNKNCHLHNYNPRMEEIWFPSNAWVIWGGHWSMFSPNVQKLISKCKQWCKKMWNDMDVFIDEMAVATMVILPNQRHSFSTEK